MNEKEQNTVNKEVEETANAENQTDEKHEEQLQPQISEAEENSEVNENKEDVDDKSEETEVDNEKAEEEVEDNDTDEHDDEIDNAVDEEDEDEDEDDDDIPLSLGVAPEEEFDWDNYSSKKDDEYSSSKRAELEALYDKTLSTINVDEVIEGTVVALTSREVVINIGYKSEGIVSLNEFRYNPELKVGDKVEVYVESQEDKNGQLVLSHKKARALRSWDRVNEALDNDEIIKGYIKCRTKGGMIVDVFGIEAFLPGSQIDVKPIRDYDIYVGKTMEFKVVKINHEFKNVVVSHKALIEEELEQQKKEIIAKLEKGQVLEGTVKNITSYGVFIDLGGVDGLIHITDLSWGRVSHPSEIVELDQKLNVVILDFDEDKKRIALGLKQLTKHPWDSLDPNLKIGDKVEGKVVVMADYGAFVEIAPGVEGLIHVSEMSWSQHLRSAQEFLQVGDKVEAVILTLDREERKMSLGIKQLKPDPWENIEEKYPVSSRHKAKVRNFTTFGVFVEIEEGVDGLIHISDLSWTKKIKHPAEFTSINELIEVKVLEIDKENRRLSLGHKQLEENPWDVFETIFQVDSVHEGTVVNVFDKGGVVALPYGVEGFATPKNLMKENGEPAKVDEKLQFKVIEFSKAAKRIILSHSKVYEDEKKAEEAKKRKAASGKKQQNKKVNINIEKTTLADIADLTALRNRLETEDGQIVVTEEVDTDNVSSTQDATQTETENKTGEESNVTDAQNNDKASEEEKTQDENKKQENEKTENTVENSETVAKDENDTKTEE